MCVCERERGGTDRQTDRERELELDNFILQGYSS